MWAQGLKCYDCLINIVPKCFDCNFFFVQVKKFLCCWCSITKGMWCCKHLHNRYLREVLWEGLTYFHAETDVKNLCRYPKISKFNIHENRYISVNMLAVGWGQRFFFFDVKLGFSERENNPHCFYLFSFLLIWADKGISIYLL